MIQERIYGNKDSLSTPEQFIPASPKIAAALDLAKLAHKDQFRQSGEPFYYHPIAVAQILESWGLADDEDLICAALLHDVPEDNKDFGLDKIANVFGPGVASLVDGVTKVDSQTATDADRETHRKVSARSYLAPKVALIKIADRLHNMRTLAAMSPHKQIEKSTETIEIYAKLAESLGLWTVKKELEDLSFMYLDPKNYKKTKQEVDTDPRLSPNFITHTVSLIENILAEKGIVCIVHTRVNGYWSLYRKTEVALLKGKTSADRGLKDINDLISFRVITEDLNSCYSAMGYLHEYFGEYVDFDRYDEFIGVNTRINGYSAIQSTLTLPAGATEIAFATKEMERFNSKGIVSLLQNGEINLEAYVLKSVFSVDGKIMFLPKNATGVDYAYLNSKRVGANARALLIDGVEMPLTVVIPNAATVEVLIGEPRWAPDPDFLNYCLPTTKAIIVDQLHLANADDLASLGRDTAEVILQSRGLLRFEDLGVLADELVFDYARNDLRDIYLMLGRGAITQENIISWLDNNNITKEKLGLTSIKISGDDRSGILSDLSKWFRDNGGNIKAIDLKTHNGSFTVLFVLNGLSRDSEEVLRKKISEDSRFQSWKVV